MVVVAVPVTVSVIVQKVAPAPGGAGLIVPPASVTEFAVNESVPPQVVEAAVAVTPTPHESVKSTGASVVAVKLLNLIVSVDVPPGATVAGENAFVSDAPVCTVMLAAIAGLVAPSAVVSAPAGIVLVTALFWNAVGLRATTCTVIVHDPVAGIVPPASAIVAGLVAGAEAVAVPGPQVVAAFDGVAIVSAAGSVSVIAALVSGIGFELFNVIVSVDTDVWVTPLPCTTFGENALTPVMFTGADTTSVACADCALVPFDDVTALAGIELR